ncbi:hypothetical protein ACFDR9_003262 [Janthinobacterium sp. CG_23.3]|uniref:hypothetical protein n=1 Tax=Janthinobacterium sp. CG_23.3 TaxID=3349634 RepID=UPI0038D41849
MATLLLSKVRLFRVALADDIERGNAIAHPVETVKNKTLRGYRSNIGVTYHIKITGIGND